MLMVILWVLILVLVDDGLWHNPEVAMELMLDMS